MQKLLLVVMPIALLLLAGLCVSLHPWKADLGLAERAGVLALKPLVQARKVEVVAALRESLRVV